MRALLKAPGSRSTSSAASGRRGARLRTRARVRHQPELDWPRHYAAAGCAEHGGALLAA